MNMDIIEKRILISKLNDIIQNAIYYGGDIGGAYFNDCDRKKLLDNMENFRLWRLGDEFMIGIVDDVPLFVEKIKYMENEE